MHTFSARVVCVVLAVVSCATVFTAQAPDPIVGTWKLNLSKSKYATPAPKSMTVTIAPAASGYIFTVDTVGADGHPQTWGYTSRFDGSEDSVSGTPLIDTVVARTTGGGATVTYKKAGAVVSSTTSALSDDGKTLTVTVVVLDPQGRELTNLAVYDRQ